jgi:hypothetical protein
MRRISLPFLAFFVTLHGSLGCEESPVIDRGQSSAGGYGGEGASGGFGGVHTVGGMGGSGGAECTNPQTDCPDPMNECLVAIYIGGSCSTKSADLNTPTMAGQIAGDCKKQVCDGAGATTVVNDDTDPNDDGNPCTMDTCNAGTNESTPVFGGMTLDQFARMIQCHDVEARVYHAESSSLDEFRKLASENLKTSGNFLVVNYERSALGQAPTGHISPVSAYHAASDQFLILDVARCSSQKSV